MLFTTQLPTDKTGCPSLKAMTFTPTLLVVFFLVFAAGAFAPRIWTAARRSVRKQRVRRELRRIRREGF